MIGRTEEYDKMFRLEGRLWWYRSLHERVLTAIQQRFGDRRDLTILDAGCGTGGMLALLQQRGYTDLRGIDGSADAVLFCRERGLPVTQLDLNDLAGFEPGVQYDVILCNDVFCYVSAEDLPELLQTMASRLAPNGVLLSNNNAFAVFRGQHDLAVGIGRRFVQADFDRLLPGAGLRRVQATYWSFFLSPLILLMRQWQNLQLATGWRKAEEARSDVYLPPAWINETLYRIVRLEQQLLPRTPFGSSLFIEAKRATTVSGNLSTTGL